MNQISKNLYLFLNELKNNNNREWFAENKDRYNQLRSSSSMVFDDIQSGLGVTDQLENHKVFRIYRDVRFSKNKLPFKTHLSTSIHREGKQLRGGYYIHLEPSNNFIACGFWNPNKEDLFRIRKELELEYQEFSNLLDGKDLKNQWGELFGEQLKSCPKGFDKEHEAIQWLRFKQFILKKSFTNEECMSKDFSKKVVDSFVSARPFLDFMTLALTTDLNGEPIV